MKLKLRKPSSEFYRWWNSYTGKRIISATYSLGASVVILGALFKILHHPIGNIMLSVGMTVESVIFALGIFDKPYREYDWSRIFNFKPEDEERLDAHSIASAVQGGVVAAVTQPMITEKNNDEQAQATYFGQQIATTKGVNMVPQGSGGMAFGGTISEEEVEKLSEGIRNLTQTAEQLQKLTDVAVAANGLAQHIESASEIAAGFANTQQKLNTSAETLSVSYQGANEEMNNVVSSTRGYSGKVEQINNNINSINSIYEIQLQQIKAQSNHLDQQAEAIKKATERLESVAADLDKMKMAASASFVESERYQTATKRLTQKVDDLNAIYGNMLNALS